MTRTGTMLNDEEFSMESRDASPANLLMKIESFSLLSKYRISEFESREFESGGHKWKIIINLGEEHISVCLSACGTKSLPMNWEINVNFTFFVFNHVSNDYLCFRGKLRRFNAMTTKCRFSNLISKKKLSDNGYLVDDNCVFGAEVFVINGDQRVNACLCLLRETAQLAHFTKMGNVWNYQEFVVGDCKYKRKPRNVDLYQMGDGYAVASIFLKCVEALTFAPYHAFICIKNKLDDANHHKNEYSVESRSTSPANLLMKIESFSVHSEYEISEYESKEFEAGGHKWKIMIYLKGEDVSVCLSACGTESLPMDEEINVMFTFFVFNHFSNEYLCFRGASRRFNTVNPRCWFSKLISKKELTDPSNGYIADDNFVFGAEVFVIKGDHRLNECLCLIEDPASAKRSWTLPNFSKMESVWNSEEFKVGGYNWKVSLYPKGNVSAQGRYVSVYLNCVDASDFAPHQRVKARLSFRVKNKLNDANNSEKFLTHWFRSSSDAWGYPEFIAIADMSSKGYLVGDYCFLETEISVQAVVLDAPSPPN